MNFKENKDFKNLFEFLRGFLSYLKYDNFIIQRSPDSGNEFLIGLKGKEEDVFSAANFLGSLIENEFFTCLFSFQELSISDKEYELLFKAILTFKK